MFNFFRNKCHIQNSAWKYRAGVHFCYQRDCSTEHHCTSRSAAAARTRLPPDYCCGSQRGDSCRSLHCPGAVLGRASGRPHCGCGAWAWAVSGPCPLCQCVSGSGVSSATAFSGIWSQSHLFWDAWDATWKSTGFLHLKHNTRYCLSLIYICTRGPKLCGHLFLKAWTLRGFWTYIKT